MADGDINEGAKQETKKSGNTIRYQIKKIYSVLLLPVFAVEEIVYHDEDEVYERFQDRFAKEWEQTIRARNG